MIRRIGVIYQDLNSLGFLRGLRARLGCEAEFVSPPSAIGKSQYLTRKQAKNAWSYFQKQGVDLIVRFTDADRNRWQDVRRAELNVFPVAARSLAICGVAVNNTEEWLCLDRDHLAQVLGISGGELADSRYRTDRIKHALLHVHGASDRRSKVVERIVRHAPGEVFRRWLADDALGMFYSDCRAAAAKANCETPDELSAGA